MIIHGYGGGEGDIEMYGRIDDREVTVEVVDFGVELKILRRLWSQCLRQDRTLTALVWDSLLWKRLWMN